jgi:hypothetical protein
VTVMNVSGVGLGNVAPLLGNVAQMLGNVALWACDAGNVVLSILKKN